MDSNLIVDAAAIGALITVGAEILKTVLPKKWIDKVLTKKKETRKERMQAIIFGVVLVCVGLVGYSAGMFHVEQLDDLIGLTSLMLTASYTVYKAVVKTVSEKFPTIFGA